MIKSKYSIRNLREDRRNTLIKLIMLSGPVGLGVALLALFVAIHSLSSQPTMPNVQAEVALGERAKNWTDDYMLQWLAGSAADGSGSSPVLQALKQKTGAPGKIEMPTNPYQVHSIKSYVADDEDIGKGDRVWRMHADTLMVAPGAAGMGRYMFAVDIISHDGSFMATTLPRLISTEANIFKIKTAYTGSADTNGSLGTAVKNFAQAYLTPTSSSATLGSTVSSDFRGSPVQRSPWSTLVVTGLNYYGDTSPEQATTGTVIYVLATIKASTSITSFSTVQLPLTMIVLSNGQWVVDELDNLVYVEDIEASDN